MEATQDLSQAMRTGGRYSVLPARALADNRLNRSDVFVLAVLATTEHVAPLERRNGWFEISQAQLAFLADMSRSSINRAVGKLEKSGYLESHAQQTSAGGHAAKIYRIIQDTGLDPVHDRWAAGLMARDPQTKNPITSDAASAHTPCAVDEHPSENGGIGDVAPTHTPCSSTAHPLVHEEHTGVKTAELVMSHQCTPPVNQEHISNSGASSDALESNLLSNKEDSKSNVQASKKGMSDSSASVMLGQPDGLVSKEDGLEISRERVLENQKTPEARVVDAFIDARKKHFPGISRGLSKREKLETQARSYLDRGLSVERFVEVLKRQISVSAEKNLGVPAGLTRFRQDLDKALRKSVGYMPAQVSAPSSVSAACHEPPKQHTGLPAVAPPLPRWDVMAERLRAAVPSLAPWMSLMTMTELTAAGAAVILVRTDAAMAQAEQHHESILSAGQEVFGAACRSVTVQMEIAQ